MGQQYAFAFTDHLTKFEATTLPQLEHAQYTNLIMAPETASNKPNNKERIIIKGDSVIFET